MQLTTTWTPASAAAIEVRSVTSTCRPHVPYPVGGRLHPTGDSHNGCDDRGGSQGACTVPKLVAHVVGWDFSARADDRQYGRTAAVLGDDPPVQRTGATDPRRQQSTAFRGPRAAA